MYLLIALLFIAIAYEAAQALNRVAGVTADPCHYSSPTSK